MHDHSLWVELMMKQKIIYQLNVQLMQTISFRNWRKLTIGSKQTNEANLENLANAVSLESIENLMKQHLKRPSAHYNPWHKSICKICSHYSFLLSFFLVFSHIDLHFFSWHLFYRLLSSHDVWFSTLWQATRVSLFSWRLLWFRSIPTLWLLFRRYGLVFLFVLRVPHVLNTFSILLILFGRFLCPFSHWSCCLGFTMFQNAPGQPTHFMF